MEDCKDPEELEESWDCPRCTYHNSGQLEAGKICEICKAWECKICTFTNERSRRARCEQCSEYKTEKLIRLILFGNKRSTRDAVANVILNRCQSKPSVVSTIDKRQIKNRDIAVINTPDCSSQDISSDGMSREFWKFIAMSLPGPHAFILVKEGNSFTNQDRESLDSYKSIFGEEIVKHMVVVTYGLDGYSPSRDEGETDDIKAVQSIQMDNSKCQNDKDQDVLELLEIVDNIFHRYSIFQNPLYDSVAKERKLYLDKKTEEKEDIEKELAIARSKRPEYTREPDSSENAITKRTNDELERQILMLEEKLRRYENQSSHSDSSKKQSGDWSEWVPIVQKVGEHLIKFAINYTLTKMLK